MDFLHLSIQLTGQPAAPADFTSDGLPIGFQIVGRHLDDATCRGRLRGRSAWRDRWPPMLAQRELLGVLQQIAARELPAPQEPSALADALPTRWRYPAKLENGEIRAVSRTSTRPVVSSSPVSC